MDGRDWIDLEGLTITKVSLSEYALVRPHLSDETYIDVRAGEAFDEHGNRLTGAGALAKVTA